MSTTPFTEFPSDDLDWTSFVAQRVEGALAHAHDLVARLKSDTASAASLIVDRWNQVEVALREAGNLTSLLSEVHTQKSVRTQAEEEFLRVQNYSNDLRQDAPLYEVLFGALQELIERDDARSDSTEATDTRLVRLTVRDFRRAGVELDDSTRAHLSALVEREVTLGQDFGRVIREDVRSIRIAPERLAGLPSDYVADHPVAQDGLVTITTDYPDYLPFIQFADDADARRELTIAFLNRGWPENDATLHQLLATRREHAQLLGFATWADFAAEDKMLNTGAGVSDFVERIATLARPSGERDRDQLLARLRQDRPDATGIDGADRSYYAEQLRREIYDVDAQEVRRYFDFDAVRAGLLEVTGRLFGLRYEAVTATTWHEDVVTYGVYALRDGAEELIGRIYLDLFPRDGKFKHAAQFDLVAGINGAYGTAPRALPEGALLCNFSRGLMEHSDVVTLFHEFGHLVHHVVGGNQAFARFSGVATEWDFVEAPSQMLEEWAWDAGVLRLFARDETGTAIGEELVGRLNAARDFAKAADVCTQMFYAATSYQLHAREVEDISTTVEELQRRYSVFDFIAGTHLAASFGHLDGYSSVYYTYMWSLVISKDLFSAFDATDLFAPSIAHRYRDAVLARGGSSDAADLVKDFLGRPYRFDAFAAWLAEGAPSA